MSLPRAFADQAKSCARMGSPFMGQLLSMLAKHWPADTPLGQMFAGFEGDIGPAGHSLPLRIAGGLHALVLSGKAPALAAVYPPNAPTDAALRETVRQALTQHQDMLLDWCQSPPQTNEVRRSAALIAAAHVCVDHFDLPIRLSELGASGGLNLTWDHYALNAGGARLGPDTPALTLSPDWTGPPPPVRAPVIASRAGVDLNPLDPTQAADLLRLTAYLWPDQPERLNLTRAAAKVAAPDVVKGDAIDWLEQRLQDPAKGQLHLIQHTVAWQYFAPDLQARGRSLIKRAGQSATPSSPLAWVSMESDGDTTAAIGAALTLRLWPGDITLDLGRADFHGRWINWQGPS